MLKYSIKIINDAEQSENRIHSDAIALGFGFRGALVAGVVVFGHMAYLPVKAGGRDWLTNNQAEVKFLKPAYDGEMLDITLEGNAARSDTKCLNPEGVLLATLTGEQGAKEAGAIHKIPAAGEPVVREEINWENLILDNPAPAYLWHADHESNQKLVKQLGDDVEIYQGDNACVHPCWMLRQCNSAFSRSFILPAWLHVGSKLTFHQPLLIGQDIEVRMIPVKKWERKGHEFTTLYVAFLVKGELFVEVEHTSIYRIASPSTEATS